MPGEKVLKEDNQLQQESVNSGNMGNKTPAPTTTVFVDNTPEAAKAKELQGQLGKKGPQQMKQEMAEKVASGKGPKLERQDAQLNLLAGQVTDVESLAKKITTTPGYIDALTDEDTMDILKTVFGSNWFHAKDVLLMDGWGKTKPEHSQGLALMKKMITLRTNTWAAFVVKTVPAIVAAVTKMEKDPAFADLVNPGKLEDNLRLGVPAGSDALTADIDVPLKGENTEIGLSVLNGAFAKEFGVESGTLFDINLYSSDWMFGGDQIEGDKGVVTFVPKEEFALDAAGIEKKDAINEVWSMVKIRRNMTPQEWEDYKTSILAGIADPAEAKEIEKRCATVEMEYAKFDDSVKTRIEAMYGATFNEMDHYKKEAATTTASNSIYEEKALKVKALRLEIKKLQGLNAPANEVEARVLALHDEIANGLTYANEVYATQGAVLHTVYGKQGAVKDTAEIKEGKKIIDITKAGVEEQSKVTAVKYKLREEMYLQSANENVGDVLHSLNHYEKNGPYGAYRAGKYLDRLVEATNFLFAEEAKTLPGYNELAEIALNALKEKKGEDGKISAGSDPMAVTIDSSYFKDKTPKDLKKIRSLTTKFGVALTTAYKNGKKAKAKPTVVES